MLRYDVTYWRDGKPLDLDRNVSLAYLESLPASLKPGEIAHARCLNGCRADDREIDQHGIHEVPETC